MKQTTKKLARKREEGEKKGKKLYHIFSFFAFLTFRHTSFTVFFQQILVSLSPSILIINLDFNDFTENPLIRGQNIENFNWKGRDTGGQEWKNDERMTIVEIKSFPLEHMFFIGFDWGFKWMRIWSHSVFGQMCIGIRKWSPHLGRKLDWTLFY